MQTLSAPQKLFNIETSMVDARCCGYERSVARNEEAVLSQTPKLNGNGNRIWVRHCSASSKIGKESIKICPTLHLKLIKETYWLQLILLLLILGRYPLSASI